MYLKKRWICIISILFLVPVAAYAQTSLYGLSANELGAGCQISESSFLGNLGMGFHDGKSRLSITGGLPTGDLGFPASYLGIEFVNRYALESDFEFFSTLEFYILASGDLETVPTVLLGVIGLSKNFGTQASGTKPFVGLLYQRVELDLGLVDPVYNYGLQAGLEYKRERFSLIAMARSVAIRDTALIGVKLGINLFL